MIHERPTGFRAPSHAELQREPTSSSPSRRSNAAEDPPEVEVDVVVEVLAQLNRDAFQAHVEQVLVCELRPGDIVVMDDLSSHKGTAIRQATEAAGARPLFPAAYSPDFNPIENAFAKLKVLLRAAAEGTVHALWTTLGSLIDRFTPETPLRLRQRGATGRSLDRIQLQCDERGFKTARISQEH